MFESGDIRKEIAPGEVKSFDLHIARLPSGTVVNMHIRVYRGMEDGPVLMLSGGLHGDEVNGIEIIRRMIQRDLLHPQAGIVIAIPVINIYGFLNFARDLPDGKDANRSFPGSRKGSLASQVAWNLQKKILPCIDYGVDFHTGGGNRSNYPQVRCEFNDETSLSLARNFAPPFIIHSGLIPGSLRSEAKNLGKRIIVFEGGQALRFNNFAIEEGIKGTQRLMSALGMSSKPAQTLPGWNSLMLNKTAWVRAEEAGLFHFDIVEGAHISVGEKIGSITDPYNDYEFNVLSPISGYAIGLNHSPVVNAGDALVHIGSTDK